MTQKRGGEFNRVELNENVASLGCEDQKLLDLDVALERLQLQDAVKANWSSCVTLRG